MALDPYSLCPCGSGKKLKFCCADLQAELNKIAQMRQSEQRVACLEYIEQLERKHPGREGLLVQKADLLRELDRLDDAIQTARSVVAAHPTNTTAWAVLVLSTASRDGGVAAVSVLQDAIEAVESVVTLELAQCFLGLGIALLDEEADPLAGRAHLETAAALLANTEGTEYLATVLSQFFGQRDISPLFKANFPLLPAPAGAAYAEAFTAARELAGQLHWRQAAAEFASLTEQNPGDPALWRNLAIIRARLADSAGAADAWRKYAALDVAHDDAVEAWALASLIDSHAEPDLDDYQRQTRNLRDVDRAVAELIASPLVEVNQPSRDPSGGPPPRLIAHLFDKPLPEDAANCHFADLPQSLGTAMVFGRQTDREARLELIAHSEQLPRARAVVEQIAGDTLDPPDEPEVIDRQPRLERMVELDRRLPPDVRIEPIRRWLAEFRRHQLLEVWCRQASNDLGGQTPRDVAGDPAWRLVLESKVLRLEVSLGQIWDASLFVELRQSLNLPSRQPIDPQSVNLRTMPPVRIERVDPQNLSDDDLQFLFNKAVSFGLPTSVMRLGTEVLKRPHLLTPGDLIEIHSRMAMSAIDTEVTIEHLHAAQAAAIRAGESPAGLYLAELTYAARSGNASRFTELMQILMARHSNEPGVQQQLARVMVSLGMLDPETGRMRRPAGPDSQTATAAADDSGKLWTPDSATPAASGNSGLWMPGMD